MLSNSEIGQRIRKRRQELGITLQEVASLVGVQSSTIQRYERGKIEKVKLPVIEAIGTALCVNPSWLLGKSENPDDDRNSEYTFFLEMFNGDAKAAYEMIRAIEKNHKEMLDKDQMAVESAGEGLVIAPSLIEGKHSYVLRHNHSDAEMFDVFVDIMTQLEMVKAKGRIGPARLILYIAENSQNWNDEGLELAKSITEAINGNEQYLVKSSTESRHEKE